MLICFLYGFTAWVILSLWEIFLFLSLLFDLWTCYRLILITLILRSKCNFAYCASTCFLTNAKIVHTPVLNCFFQLMHWHGCDLLKNWDDYGEVVWGLFHVILCSSFLVLIAQLCWWIIWLNFLDINYRLAECLWFMDEMEGMDFFFSPL